ncbi:MAG: hypothetical protein ACAH88_13880 [Roseimicrobium sp.]
MDDLPDIICPDCGARHGPAAKTCECGRSFVVEEAPAPPSIFFAISGFFAVVTVWSAEIANKNGYVYLPIGSMLFFAVAFTLGVRSWLWGLRNRSKR